MNPRNDAAFLCKNHPEDEAVDNWPWKKADRMCYTCVDQQQAAVDSRIRADKAKGWPDSGWEQFAGRTGYDSSSASHNPNNLPEKKDRYE